MRHFPGLRCLLMALSDRYCAAIKCRLLGVKRTHVKWRWSILRPNDRELVTAPVDELMAQYSSANMMVMTRSVMDGSDGSRE